MEIREALEAAVTEHEEPTSVQEITPEVQAAPVEASPESTESSTETVVETAAEDKPVPAEKPEAAPASAKTEVPVAGEKPQHRVDRPPQSWKKEAKTEWGNIPLHVRQEVYKREMEVERVLKETAPLREQVQQIQSVVAPYMARIQANGVTPVEAMDHLFKADYLLATAPRQQKAQLMAKLISDYDISIEDLDAALVASMKGQQAPQPQGFDPNYVNQLVQQQLQQALAPIYQERQQQEQQFQQKVAQTVEQMALDPQYPHFDEVRDEMADLIEVAAKRGVALSLEDAYHRAVAINPAINEQQSRQAQMTTASNQHQMAQKAKIAASSVSGAPASGGAQAIVGDGSLRGAIEAAFGGARL